jgi:hypothetical protein
MCHLFFPCAIELATEGQYVRLAIHFTANGWGTDGGEEFLQGFGNG